MGTRDGSIMATIITIHIPMKAAAAPGQVCPGILIHAMDMVQSPGIDMPPDMDAHQEIVTQVLATKRRALVPRSARLPASILVLVVVTDPLLRELQTVLVPSLRN
jgi:hypothetical protein